MVKVSYCQCCGKLMEGGDQPHEYDRGGEKVYLCFDCNYTYRNYWPKVKQYLSFFQMMDRGRDG